MQIVDAFNEVGNNFAITSAGIGEAMKRTASSMSAAGNTMHETIGLIVAANNVIQDPDVVGTAVRTISMRLRNTAGQLEELDEDAQGAAESITQLQTRLLNLTKGKVDIMLDENTFKSTYQIITEISTVWSDLSDKTQADITRLVAGLRGGNVFNALMTNMASGADAVATSLNSLGSATKENELFLESINGRLTKLSSSFQALASSTINSGFVKFIIDIATGFLDFLNATNLLIPSLLAVGVALANWKIPAILKPIDILIGRMQLLLLANTNYTASSASAAVAQLGLGKSIKVVTGAIWQSTAALLSNPIVLGVMATALAVGAAAWISYANSVEAAEKKVEKASVAYSETKSELEKISSELKTASDRMNELNSKKKPTFAEEGELQRLKDITEELKIQEDILSRKEKKDKRELVQSQADLYKKQYGDMKYSADSMNEYILDSYISGNTAILQSEKENINAMLAAYSRLLDFKSEAISNYNEAKEIGADTEIYADDIGRVSDELSDLKDNLFDQIPVIENFIKAFESIPEDEKIEIFGADLTQQYINAQSLIEGIYKSLDPAKWKEMQFSKFLSTPEINETKKSLDELAASGKLTAETLNDPKYKDLISILEEYGFTIEDLLNQLNDIPISQDKINVSLTDLEKSFKDASDKISLLQSVQKDYLTSSASQQLEMLQKLRDIAPEYIELLFDQGGAYIGLANSAEIYAKMEEELRQNLDNSIKIYNELDEAIWKLGEEQSEDYELQDKLNAQKIETMILIEQQRNLLDSLSDTFSKTASNATILNDAIREQTKNGKISKETYEILLSLGDEYAGLVEIINGEYILLTDSARKLNREQLTQLYQWGLLNGMSDGALAIILSLINATDDMTDSNKSLVDSVKKISDYYSGLSTAMDTYNKEGVLTLEQTIALLESNEKFAKYLVKTKDGYKLTKDAVKDLDIAEKAQMQTMDEHIKKLQDEQFGTKEFAKSYNELIDSVSKDYDDYPMQKMFAQIKAVNDSFIDGKINAVEYFDGLQKSMVSLKGLNFAFESASSQVKKLDERLEQLDLLKDSLDEESMSANEYIKKLKEIEEEYSRVIKSKRQLASADFRGLETDKGLQEMFMGFAQATAQGIDYINRQFESGQINFVQYSNSINEASENLLDLHVVANNLKQDTEGHWIDEAGDIDDYADSLQSAQNKYSELAPILETIGEWYDYISKNADAFSKSAFDAADEGSESFKNMAKEVADSFNEMLASGTTASQEILSKFMELTGKTESEVLDAQGRMTSSAIDDAIEVNAMMSAVASQTGKSVTSLSQGIGNVLSALADAISSFDYTIDVTPVATGGITQMINALLFGGKMPTITIGIQGRGAEGVASAFRDLAGYMTSMPTDFGFKPTGGGKKEVAKPEDLKGGGGGGGKEEDEWLKEYERLYAELQHLRKMDIIDDEEYRDRLILLDAKYFGNNEKYISEHRENLEELEFTGYLM